MPLSVTYNAKVVVVPPRLEEIVLFLLRHQELICRMPTCGLEFHCGSGREVKGRLKIELERPQHFS